MKKKVIWFCHRKTISGSYLKQNNSYLAFQTRTIFFKWVMYRSNRSFDMPPPTIWHLCRPGEEEIWSPCFRGGEFELHPQFHVKSLAWGAMGDAVLEDFRGKDCTFVANWLQGKGLNKLCGGFEVFKFKIFNIGFRLWMYECILLLCLQWNTIPLVAIQ